MRNTATFDKRAMFGTVRSPVDVLTASIRAVRAAIRRHFDEQRAVEQLESMTDRQLRDIGLYRSEIRSAVRGIDQDITRRRR